MRFGAVLSACLFLAACASHSPQKSATAERPVSVAAAAPESHAASVAPWTSVSLHNVILREQSGLRLRVRWLRGRLFPTKVGVTPSFDDPGSFIIVIDEGTLSANLKSFSNVLSERVFKNSPITNLKLAAYGRRLKITGTFHKGLPLPVQLIGSVSAASDGRIHIHADKLAVLKVPLKGVMDILHLKASDFFDPKGIPGVEVSGDDIYIDSEQILPPPRKRGKVTEAHLTRNGDLVETYGKSSRTDMVRVKGWRNFMRLSGGSIKFGKLTMENADLFLIDVSQEDWFEFDFANYEEQLVNGYIRMTPEAGLHVFMPGLTQAGRTAANRRVGMQWLKNRNAPPPPDPQ